MHVSIANNYIYAKSRKLSRAYASFSHDHQLTLTVQAPRYYTIALHATKHNVTTFIAH